MDIKALIDDYAQWFRQEITAEAVGDYYEITTPFLDNANDYIQFYVKLENNNIFFTDDGWTLNQLAMTGYQLNATRRGILKSILVRYGVGLEGDCLISKSDAKAFPQKKHLFIQAIMAVDDLFMSARGRRNTFFLEDVQDFFSTNNIYYTDNVQFTGISGLSHNYDFLLQRSERHPERLCRVINNPVKSNVGNVLFAWNDTKPSRRTDSKLIVFLNDSKPIADEVEEAFINYEASVIKWKDREREENLELLRA